MSAYAKATRVATISIRAARFPDQTGVGMSIPDDIVKQDDGTLAGQRMQTWQLHGRSRQSL